MSHGLIKRERAEGFPDFCFWSLITLVQPSGHKLQIIGCGSWPLFKDAFRLLFPTHGLPNYSLLTLTMWLSDRYMPRKSHKCAHTLTPRSQTLPTRTGPVRMNLRSREQTSVLAEIGDGGAWAAGAHVSPRTKSITPFVGTGGKAR